MNGIGMRNDLDITRAILEQVRDRKDLWPQEVTLPGKDPLVVSRHIERLFEDGMLDGEADQLMGSFVSTVYVRDLTSAGHQFLSALEAGDIWARLKATLKPSELGALSLKQLATIAGDLAEQQIRKKLGL